MSRDNGAMALVNTCRTPIRRRIMILAEEANARGETISAKRIADVLDVSLSGLSYHVKELAKAGALKEVGGEQKRGAWQKNYVPSEAFQATMTDTVALDQIAELLDGGITHSRKERQAILRLVRATGRPVEA